MLRPDAALREAASAAVLPTPQRTRAGWLLVGVLGTTIGDGLHTITVGRLLYDQTGSATAFGGLIVFEQLLTLLTQLVAGPWIDRRSPRLTGIGVEALRGSLICGASIALFLRPSDLSLAVVVMAIAIKVGRPFYRSSIFALSPLAVAPSRLARFNASLSMCQQGGALLGVAIAGPLFFAFGAPAAFFVNGLSFLFSAATITFVAVDVEPHQSAATSMLGNWTEILLLLRRAPGLSWHIIISGFDQLGVAMFNLMLMPIVATRCGDSAYWLSLLDGAYAVGAIVAGLLPSVGAGRGARIAIALGISGQTAGFALLAFCENRYVTVAVAAAIGAAATLSWTAAMTTLQLRARGPIKGRIAILRGASTAVSTALIVPTLGRLAHVSLTAALLSSSAVCLAFALLVFERGREGALGSALLGEGARSSEPAPAVGTAAARRTI